MKKLLSFTLFCCALATFTSCSKSTNEPEASKNGFSKTSSDSAAVMELLVNKFWKYYEYYSSFNDSGALVPFKANRTQNFQQFWFVRMNFGPDFVYNETDKWGNKRGGLWSFINNGEGIQVTTDQGTFSFTITRLEENRFEWIAPDGSYGFLILEDDWPSNGGDLAQMLTAHVWKYESYMTNYQSGAASLVYRNNKSNNITDLSLNRAQFNTDGTCQETDQYGSTIAGTWTLNGVVLEVNNSLGTFTYHIQVLNNERYEWQDPDFTIRGEMVPE